MCLESYFAGLLDGEGYVSIRTVRRSKQHPDWISYAVQVTISNCDRRPLDIGRERWHGFLATKETTRTGKPIYHWMLTSQNASRFLADVYPYLIIKREQAYLALLLQTHLDETGRNGLRLTPEVLDYRKGLQDRIKSYNARKYYGLTVEDKILQEQAARASVGGGCLNCGCGDMWDNRGDPTSLTYTRLALIGSRTGLKPLAVAENILGTVLGEIKKSDPRQEGDLVIFKLVRLNKNGRLQPKRYAPRSTDPTGGVAARREAARKQRKIERQARYDDAHKETDLPSVREDT